MKTLSTLIAISALLLCSACAVSPTSSDTAWMSSVPQTASAGDAIFPKN